MCKRIHSRLGTPTVHPPPPPEAKVQSPTADEAIETPLSPESYPQTHTPTLRHPEHSGTDRTSRCVRRRQAPMRTVPHFQTGDITGPVTPPPDAFQKRLGSDRRKRGTDAWSVPVRSIKPWKLPSGRFIIRMSSRTRSGIPARYPGKRTYRFRDGSLKPFHAERQQGVRIVRRAGSWRVRWA